jgi:RNA polymerase sigma factor (sigma-70 family)
MKDDATLLQSYARNRSESDFAELVRRHVNLVYSAALRQVNGDAHLAQDVTQLVFTDLARKAGSLVNYRVLAGWLFTSTRFAASKLVRGEQRRRQREQEAQSMQEITTSDSAASLDWARVRPVLDEALAELGERDRDAILLRYLEGRDFTQVGAKLALSDNAARMRVDRAVDKLRTLLARRGVTSSAAALALALTTQAVAAAPVGLAATVTGAALATGGGLATAVTFMSLTKLQIGIAGAVIAAGVSGYLMQEKNNAALRAELASFHQPAGEIAQLQESNRQLARAASDAASLRVDDAEFVRLRDEAAAVQNRIQANALAVAARPLAASPSSVLGPTFDVAQLDQKPIMTRPFQPAYPFKMSRAGIEGNVTVEMVIDAAGKVASAQVLRSSNKEFEAATLAAVMRWQFTPGQKDGQRVNTKASQLIEFQLDDSSKTAPPEWF